MFILCGTWLALKAHPGAPLRPESCRGGAAASAGFVANRICIQGSVKHKSLWLLGLTHHVGDLKGVGVVTGMTDRSALPCKKTSNL